MISDLNGKAVVLSVTDTQLSYVSVIRSAIQTQVNTVSTSIMAQTDAVTVVSGTGNVLYTPARGSMLGSVTMTRDAGKTITIFQHNLIIP